MYIILLLFAISKYYLTRVSVVF